MFRILCLDGGGIKGVFTAAALARIEEQTKRKIVDHFDVICGTSTGGILAIGLAMGLLRTGVVGFLSRSRPGDFSNDKPGRASRRLPASVPRRPKALGMMS